MGRGANMIMSMKLARRYQACDVYAVVVVLFGLVFVCCPIAIRSLSGCKNLLDVDKRLWVKGCG